MNPIIQSSVVVRSLGNITSGSRVCSVVAVAFRSVRGLAGRVDVAVNRVLFVYRRPSPDYSDLLRLFDSSRLLTGIERFLTLPARVWSFSASGVLLEPVIAALGSMQSWQKFRLAGVMLGVELVVAGFVSWVGSAPGAIATAAWFVALMGAFGLVLACREIGCAWDHRRSRQSTGANRT